MSRLHVSERDYGDNAMMLNCPVCGWYGEIWYKTAQPVYCSDKCKQKAYRLRKQKDVTAIPLQVRQDVITTWSKQGLDQAGIKDALSVWKKYGYSAACDSVQLALAFAIRVRSEL